MKQLKKYLKWLTVLIVVCCYLYFFILNNFNCDLLGLNHALAYRAGDRERYAEPKIRETKAYTVARLSKAREIETQEPIPVSRIRIIYAPHSDQVLVADAVMQAAKAKRRQDGDTWWLVQNKIRVNIRKDGFVVKLSLEAAETVEELTVEIPVGWTLDSSGDSYRMADGELTIAKLKKRVTIEFIE